MRAPTTSREVPGVGRPLLLLLLLLSFTAATAAAATATNKNSNSNNNNNNNANDAGRAELARLVAGAKPLARAADAAAVPRADRASVEYGGAEPDWRAMRRVPGGEFPFTYSEEAKRVRRSQRERWPDGYSALCACVRDQRRDLRHWVEYHAWLGVDKFYVFDHNSTRPLASGLSDYLATGLVELQAFKGRPRRLPSFLDTNQWRAYQACIEQHRGRHRWIGFLDVDEFIVFDTTARVFGGGNGGGGGGGNGGGGDANNNNNRGASAADGGDAPGRAAAAAALLSLPSSSSSSSSSNHHHHQQQQHNGHASEGLWPLYLQQHEHFGNNKASVGGVALNWVLYASGGLASRPRGGRGPMRSFTACAPREHRESRHFKVAAVHTGHVLAMGGTPHAVVLKPGAPDVVDAAGRAVKGAPLTADEEGLPVWSPVALHHYATKSRAEFLAKEARGTGASNRKDAGYWAYAEGLATGTCDWARAVGEAFEASYYADRASGAVPPMPDDWLDARRVRQCFLPGEEAHRLDAQEDRRVQAAEAALEEAAMALEKSREFVPVRVLRKRLAKIDDPMLRGKIDAAVEMTRRALDLYSHERVALSFNGGKDSTVLLHLLRLALFDGGGGGGGGAGGEGDDAEGEEEEERRHGLRGVRSFYFDTSAPAAAAAAIAEERGGEDDEAGGGGGGGAAAAAAAAGPQQQQPPGDFCEVAAFVRATDAAYGLGVDYLTDSDFKRGLERYCAGGNGGLTTTTTAQQQQQQRPDSNNATKTPSVAAILLGTRRGDPNAEGQDHFCPSSRGWPAFLRVNPVLDWGYGDVWRFLRLGGLPYCSLYDRGYTSLGSPATTAPNAALRLADGSFAPAHELADGRLERQGRRSKPWVAAPAAAAAAAAGEQQQRGGEAAATTTTPLSSSLPSLQAPSAASPAAADTVTAIATTTTITPPTPTSTRARYAVVVLVGDELLAGRVRDANSPFLCAELRRLGWAVRRVVIVPDDVESVALAVAAASRDADAVITAGGVGPTRDDVTLAGVASAIEGGGGRLLRHPEAERALVDYFGASRVTEAHLKMAEVPGAGDVELIWGGGGGALVRQQQQREEEEEGAGAAEAAAAGDAAAAAAAAAARRHRRPSPFPLVRVNNIYVLPGVPSLLRQKWTAVRRRLVAMDGGEVAAADGDDEEGGELEAAARSSLSASPAEPLLPFKTATLCLHAPDEAAVAPCLDALAEERGAGVMIGSYPVDVYGGDDDDDGPIAAMTTTKPSTTATKPPQTTLRVVLESKDSAGLDAAVDRLTELLRDRLGDGALLGVERDKA